MALAITYWPPGIAIMNEYEYPADAEEEIMPTCYGLNGENGEFKAAELLDRIRTAVLMATQAARSAAPHSKPNGRNVPGYSGRLYRCYGLVLVHLGQLPDDSLGTRPVADAGGGAAPGRSCPADCRHTGRRAAVAAGAPPTPTCRKRSRPGPPDAPVW